MDNTTILFNAIQRTYRNAIVGLIRTKLTQVHGTAGIDQVRRLFGKKNAETQKTHWETISDAANERRSGGTGELSTPIRDEYELIGVESFFNIFENEAVFDALCPSHANKPKKERSQARNTVTTWMKQIKNVRDPVSHPVTEDINYEESAQVLYCARKILDFCALPEASAQILRLQSTLFGGFSSDPPKIFVALPPADEVVMDFVGRHGELAALYDWLKTTTKRWALSGDGGKGKSAIAYTFGQSVGSRDDHGLDAVLWISAKRRRFVEGSIVLVDRPDFYDKASAIRAIISFFETCEGEGSEERALQWLNNAPALLIVDDLDTVEGEGEDSIQFLLMTVPERTKSRVLITSRRAVFGMANLTTQVQGLLPHDGEEFIKSRCDLMGTSATPVLALRDKLLEVTDSSPLYIEDLLRLTQAGLSIEKAIGLWLGKRGEGARKYALQREYDQLDDDAKQILLALTVHGPCRTEDLCCALEWSEHRLLNAMLQLRKMFLMPSQKASAGAQVLALNGNTQLLVKEVFWDTEAYRRTQRMLQAATGVLKTKRSEEQRVDSTLRQARLLANQYHAEEAEEKVVAAQEAFPGRADIHATLAWIQKKQQDYASARINFKRAFELGSNDRDAFWHWSDMEATTEEWGASAKAAQLGLDKFGQDQGLSFRLGYALHRQGRELTLEGDEREGSRLCREAQHILERALTLSDSEKRNYSLRNQIHRAIVLNLEAIGEEVLIANHFVRWEKECPDDSCRESEYLRLRQKFPRYLCAR
jgi:tetratricopeptide (TPR) repeat protein